MEQNSLFLYHMVPENMSGNILYPLNTLKTINEKLYLDKVSKYKGREQVLEQSIPTLDCLWNDVIHLSPINPLELKEALIEAGMKPREMKFYKIDPSLLDPTQTTVCLFSEGATERSVKNFVAYDPKNLSPYSTLPEYTKNYYKEMSTKNERPLWFIRVPHILYKGSIDVSNLETITT